MNNKTLLFLLLTCVAFCAFAIGYWFGTDKTLKQLNAHILETTPIAEQSKQIPQQITTKNKGSSHENNKSLLLHGSDKALDNSHQDQNNKAVNEPSSDLLSLSEDATIVEMMEFLALIAASENTDDIDQFGPTIDTIRNLVNTKPENLQILIEYYINSDAETQSPYYFTSILQGANIEDKDLIISDMVNRLSVQGTNNANKKLLHLVSSTGAYHDNEPIIDTLKNIALYETEGKSRTYALDLLMPYQLNIDEKAKVVNDLSFALEQAPSEEVSSMVENIIRFSEKENRNELAANYLVDTNEFVTRVAILSTLHSGTIKPSDALKTQLFTIARNPSDPLSKHAKDTLMYVFEIDNNEYNRLKGGG
jgi:hypothetical protein